MVWGGGGVAVVCEWFLWGRGVCERFFVVVL